MVLGLKPGHACGVISVVAVFMVDGAWVEAHPCVRPMPCLFELCCSTETEDAPATVQYMPSCPNFNFNLSLTLTLQVHVLQCMPACRRERVHTGCR